MLLPAYRRTVGTNHKLMATVAISSWTPSKSKVVAHGLACLINESVAVVDRTDHVDRRRPKRHKQAIAVFQHQVRKCVRAGCIRPKLENNAACGPQAFHSFHKISL